MKARGRLAASAVIMLLLAASITLGYQASSATVETGKSRDGLCSASIVSRRLILAGVSPVQQQLLVRVECRGRVSSVHAYYAGVLLPSKVNVNGSAATINIAAAPLEGTIVLSVELAGGARESIALNITIPTLASLTTPSVNPENVSERLKTLEELVTRLYSYGITAVVGADNGAASPSPTASEARAPASITRGSKGLGAGEAERYARYAYPVVALATLLLLLTRYRRGSRYASQSG